MGHRDQLRSGRLGPRYLLWVYYSAQILFFGAEVTKAHADDTGTKKPAESDMKGFVK